MWQRAEGRWHLRQDAVDAASGFALGPRDLDEVLDLGQRVRYNVTIGKIKTNQRGEVDFGELADAIERLNWRGDDPPAWSDRVKMSQRPTDSSELYELSSESRPVCNDHRLAVQRSVADQPWPGIA